MTDADNAARFEDSGVELLILGDDTFDGASTEFETADTAADDPAQLYYTSGTTGMAKGIVHAHRYLLAHEEFTYCHEVEDGERFHGMGEWAWAAGIAPLLGSVAPGRRAVRVPARGRLRPAQAARLPQPPRGDERVHDTDGDARDDGRGRSAGEKYPQKLPPRLLGRRAAQPRGDPVVPRGVRDHRPRLLRADRVLPALRELPVHGGPRGLDGKADARLGGGDPRRGRAARGARRQGRDLPPRPLEPSLSARLLAKRRGGRRRPSAATGSTRRTPRPRTRTATTGTRAAPTT